MFNRLNKNVFLRTETWLFEEARSLYKMNILAKPGVDA